MRIARLVAIIPQPRRNLTHDHGVFAPAANGPLIKRAVDGSIAPFTTLTTAESAHLWPSFLDDGRHVVFLVTSSDASRAGIWIASLDQPELRKRLIAANTQSLTPASQTDSPVRHAQKQQHAVTPIAETISIEHTAHTWLGMVGFRW